MQENNRFSILRNSLDIEAIRGSWMQLQCYPNSDIDFFLTIINARKETTSPYVIIVDSAKNPEAIVVGRLEESYVPIKLGYKVLFKVKANIIVIVYDGILGNLSPATNETIIFALREALKQKTAAMVRLELINIDSTFAKIIRQDISSLCRENFLEPKAHWTMRIPSSIDEIYPHLSGNHRNQLRRIIKKLEADYTKESIRIRCFQTVAELETMFNDVEQIAKKTYQRGLGVGFINNEENRVRLLLEAKQGWLQMNVLYLNGLPCAYWWGVKYKNTFHSCALGYDPEFQNYSPGTYLLIKVLEYLCHQDINELNFGSGDARYKQQFGQSSYNEASINLYAPTIKGIGLNLALSINNAISITAKYILKRFQLIESLKKYWRQKLRPT